VPHPYGLCKGAGFPFMRNPLRRYYGQGHLHFITFSCHRRSPLLGTRRARDSFVRILDEVRSEHEFRLAGYVVMPEHVHLLLSEPSRGNLSKVLQVLKQRVSRALHRRHKKALPNQVSLTFARSRTDEQAFWQRRFYDFNVWSSRKVKEKLEYMHANPVQRKLVLHPKDWPWSSWSFYEKGQGGLTRIDPVGEGSQSSPHSTRGTIQEPHPRKPQGCGTQNRTEREKQNPHP
jgi:putative transposase